MQAVTQWGVFETRFDAPEDASPTVTFLSPSGRRHVVSTFRAGGRTWCARFSPDETGRWRWQRGEESGSFDCVPELGDNPLYRHGPLRLSDDRRHLVHADGTPFFWLSDTAWNGVLRAKPEDWRHYLAARRQQGFSAVQFVSTEWRGCSKDPAGETTHTAVSPIRINTAFFQRLDAKVAAINEHGLVAAPVILWALMDYDPGQALSEDDACTLARYITARYGAYQVVWFLGGDCDYLVEGRPERWKRLGRAVFGDDRSRLVTLHPCGRRWVGEDFRDEPWYDFIGYQSGHGDSAEDLRWLVCGPPATAWRNDPVLPVLNLEPNYETHPAYQSRTPFTDREVRRAAYWSLLVSPTAGVSFGHNAVWPWQEAPGIPERHERIGVVGPWRSGLDSAGVRSMTVLRRFFDGLPWWKLCPAPELVADQSPESEPERFTAAAKTADGSTAVIYMPVGGGLSLAAETLRRPAGARWFNPRSGTWTRAAALTGPRQTFAAPDEADWVLVIGA